MTARHLKGTTGVLLLRINTAFSLPSHALYFLQSLVTLWEDAMSEHELQQQGPAFCLSVLCLWPPPHSSSSDVFTPGNVLGPCWENSSHQLPPRGLQALPMATAMTCAPALLGIPLLSLPCTCTCLEGKRAGRRSGPQLCFQNQITVWSEIGHFFPRKKADGTSYNGSLQVGKGNCAPKCQGDEPAYQCSFDNVTEFFKWLTWCFLFSL